VENLLSPLCGVYCSTVGLLPATSDGAASADILMCNFRNQLLLNDELERIWVGSVKREVLLQRMLGVAAENNE